MEKTLIVVDLQRGFVTDFSAHVVAPLEQLQHQFENVVFTKFSNPDPSPFREILNYQKLSPGDDDTEFALQPRADAFIIERSSYTCVTSKLREHLARLQCREVFVCGIATEACVLKTVADLFEANIRPIVLENMCASDKSDDFHDMAIKIIRKLIGEEQVITSRQLKI